MARNDLNADGDDDENMERRVARAMGRAHRLLDDLRLTVAEREFARSTGEQILDLVNVEFGRPLIRAKECDERCMAAAAAFALSILHETGAVGAYP